MNKYLVYLEWPEQCFRVNAEALRFLRTKVKRGSVIKRVRNDEELLKELPTATHVITWHFKEEWYGVGKRLKVVATPAAGRELVELPADKSVRVPEIHFGHFHGAAIAESVLAYMLAWCRGVLQRNKESWQRQHLSDKMYRVAGTKAVILGYGNIGKAIGSLLEKVEVEVKGIRRANFSSIYKEVKGADWLICALPSDTGTDNLVDAKLLRCMKKRSILINIGRGNCVDELALGKALAENKIAAAILDVVKHEPTWGKCHRGGALGDCALPQIGPRGAIVMGHSSAFYPEYVKDAIDELDRDGLLS